MRIGSGIRIGTGIAIRPSPPENGSLGFNGSSQYLDIASTAVLGLGAGDFTMEYWWRPTVSRRSDVIDLVRTGTVGVSNASRLIFGARVVGSNLGIWVDSIPTNIVYNAISGPTLASLLNSWNHIALTRQSGSIKLWVNGAQSGSTYSAATLDFGTSMKLRIMGDSNTAGDGSGNLTNIRIVTGTAVYTETFTPPTSPLTKIAGTQLLLNTTNDENFLKDSSDNNLTVSNVGSITSSALNPF